MSTAIAVILIAAVVLPGSFLAARHPLLGVWWYGSWAIAETVYAAIDAARHDWGSAVLMVVCAAVNAWLWNRSRKQRKRKRAAALAGAKSRARIAKLVQRAREAMQPRPVPQPIPRGTR